MPAFPAEGPSHPVYPQAKRRHQTASPCAKTHTHALEPRGPTPTRKQRRTQIPVITTRALVISKLPNMQRRSPRSAPWRAGLAAALPPLSRAALHRPHTSSGQCYRGHQRSSVSMPSLTACSRVYNCKGGYRSHVTGMHVYACDCPSLTRTRVSLPHATWPLHAPRRHRPIALLSSHSTPRGRYRRVLC